MIAPPHPTAFWPWPDGMKLPEVFARLLLVGDPETCDFFTETVRDNRAKSLGICFALRHLFKESGPVRKLGDLAYHLLFTTKEDPSLKAALIVIVALHNPSLIGSSVSRAQTTQGDYDLILMTEALLMMRSTLVD